MGAACVVLCSRRPGCVEDGERALHLLVERADQAPVEPHLVHVALPGFTRDVEDVSRLLAGAVLDGVPHEAIFQVCCSHW